MQKQDNIVRDFSMTPSRGWVGYTMGAIGHIKLEGTWVF